jgi:hypothetical protein
MAVVVRYTDYEGTTPDQRVALMRAFPDAEEADQEAARLNAVAARQGQAARYFVSILVQRAK